MDNFELYKQIFKKYYLNEKIENSMLKSYHNHYFIFFLLIEILYYYTILYCLERRNRDIFCHLVVPADTPCINVRITYLYNNNNIVCIYCT